MRFFQLKKRVNKGNCEGCTKLFIRLISFENQILYLRVCVIRMGAKNLSGSRED